MNIYLCNEKTERGSFYLTAVIKNDCLRISGQDLYSDCENNPFGTDEVEYFYDLDLSNTKKIIELITDTGLSIEEALLAKFSGMDGSKNLREFCKANDVEYKFFSYNW